MIEFYEPVVEKLTMTLIGVIGIVLLLAGLWLVFSPSRKDSSLSISSSGPSAIATAIPGSHKEIFTPEQRAEIGKIFLDEVRQKPDQFIKEFNQLIDNLKKAQPLTQGDNPVKADADES